MHISHFLNYISSSESSLSGQRADSRASSVENHAPPADFIGDTIQGGLGSVNDVEDILGLSTKKSTGDDQANLDTDRHRMQLAQMCPTYANNEG